MVSRHSSDDPNRKGSLGGSDASDEFNPLPLGLQRTGGLTSLWNQNSESDEENGNDGNVKFKQPGFGLADIRMYHPTSGEENSDDNASQTLGGKKF